MGLHYEHLTAEERATIMVMKRDDCSARHIARILHRSPSTISRELKRFDHWPDRPILDEDNLCPYDARAAAIRARRNKFKPRRDSKLAAHTLLFGVVHHFLSEGWSPAQIAGTLKLMWPNEPQLTVSHETIYTCIYAMPRGELRKDLIACLRRAQSKRMPRARGEDRRGQLPDILSIHVRPPEANDRAFPGHWEGDLIKGAGNRSAVGVLVERSSRLVMLAKLADASAESALEGFSARLESIAEEPMRQTLTYDQGKEMSRHAELTERTGVKVYFCDPHSPWQRGSCENLNGLLRQYLPKGTDLSVYSQEDLDVIADKLNSRPRAIHGFYPPISVYRAMLERMNQSNESIQ
jgi:IS30 family transposase